MKRMTPNSIIIQSYNNVSKVKLIKLFTSSQMDLIISFERENSNL